jgi:hypothetical protein
VNGLKLPDKHKGYNMAQAEADVLSVGHGAPRPEFVVSRDTRAITPPPDDTPV